LPGFHFAYTVLGGVFLAKKISSLGNPTIKFIRSLYTRKAREKTNMAILEGTRLVQDALDADVGFREVLCSESFCEGKSGSELLQDIREVGAEVIVVPDFLIERISDTKSPQGIIASIDIKEASLAGVFEDLPSLLLVLDSVQDPGNVGTLIRTAAAAGADCVILTEGCADVYNPKTLRASMGAVFRLPVVERADCGEIMGQLKTTDTKLVAADSRGEMEYCDTWCCGRTCLVVGNEARGVSDGFSISADVRIQIPMERGIESLNVAIAGSILLYEAYRQSAMESE
jgi:TrmH family RNA methyltransferase